MTQVPTLSEESLKLIKVAEQGAEAMVTSIAGDTNISQDALVAKADVLDTAVFDLKGRYTEAVMRFHRELGEIDKVAEVVSANIGGQLAENTRIRDLLKASEGFSFESHDEKFPKTVLQIAMQEVFEAAKDTVEHDGVVRLKHANRDLNVLRESISHSMPQVGIVN